MKQQMCNDLLTWNQLQEGVDSVNNSVEDEYESMKHTHTHFLHRWQHKRVGLKFDNKQLQQTRHNLEFSIKEGVDKNLYTVL